ncbi:MAG: hypothetical protein ACKV2Q_35190 [Planctomycetaceae bacterium]
MAWLAERTTIITHLCPNRGVSIQEGRYLMDPKPTDAELIEILEAALAIEPRHMAKQHRDMTADCPPLSRFATATTTGWTTEEEAHRATCRYCQLTWRAVSEGLNETVEPLATDADNSVKLGAIDDRKDKPRRTPVVAPLASFGVGDGGVEKTAVAARVTRRWTVTVPLSGAEWRGWPQREEDRQFLLNSDLVVTFDGSEPGRCRVTWSGPLPMSKGRVRAELLDAEGQVLGKWVQLEKCLEGAWREEFQHLAGLRLRVHYVRDDGTDVTWEVPVK